MRIAIIGLRTIGPTALGGIEKVVEHLSTRYVSAGHDVTVFVRARYAQDAGSDFMGVRLKALPAIYTKHLEAITNTVAAILYSLRGYDIVHINALGPALLSFIPRMFGRKVVVTIHGQDWKREKWGRFAKMVLRAGEWAAITFPHRTIVVSRTLKQFEKTRFGKNVDFIPNGVTLPAVSDANDKNALGLEKDDYILFLSRLVPEKGCHTLIEAFRKLKTSKKLVIAGAPLHSDDYEKRLHELAAPDERILFPGPLYGDQKDSAFRDSYFFVLPSSIEGMAIVLLEALSYGKCCLVSDIEENLEVIFPTVNSDVAVSINQQLHDADGETPREEMFGMCFKSGDANDLARKIDYLVRHPTLVMKTGQKARQLVATRHDWDRIAQEHLDVYRELVGDETA